MKTRFTFFIVLFSVFNLFAQKYESGYYIDNAGNKFEGFIKDVDWKNNPTSFNFKKTIEAETTNIDITGCKEFSINNAVRFTRAKVQIEESSTTLLTLSDAKDPSYVEKTLFLKNIVDGKNSLYFYKNQGIEKFFFSNDKTNITQLIYIKYLSNGNSDELKNVQANTVMHNETYKRQLWANVKCDQTKMDEVNKLEFNKSSLQKYFSKVNTCDGSTENVVYNEKKGIVNIKAVALINSDEIKFSRGNLNSGLDRKINFGVGAEIEILLPFNNYKWGLFVEPNFTKYKNEQSIKYGLNNSLTQKVTVDANIIQLPVGARYYFGDSSKSSFYIGAGVNITNIKEDTFIDFENTTDLYFENFTYTLFGTLGYKFKQFSTEFRFNTTNNASPTDGYEINFNRASLVLKYEFFRK